LVEANSWRQVAETFGGETALCALGAAIGGSGEEPLRPLGPEGLWWNRG